MKGGVQFFLYIFDLKGKVYLLPAVSIFEFGKIADSNYMGIA